MKKYFFIASLVFLFISCNDGDEIVSNFDFDQETSLNLCSSGSENVLHFINSETNEAISFRFQRAGFDGKFSGLCPPEPIEIDINSSNEIVYRRLSGSINSAAYFCQQVPPSQPRVVEEFRSTSGGKATLFFGIQSQDDNDGVPAQLEDLNGNGNLFDDDSDGDGIPNFLDTDDDNDNVPTAVEIIDEFGNSPNNPDNAFDFVDFDGDGIPNYLDEDDDGDGVISRYEDLNAFDELDDDGNPILNPQTAVNEQGVPHYLNPEISEELVIDLYRPNVITRTFRVQVVIENVSLQRADGEQTITFGVLQLGNYQVTSNNEVLEMTFEPSQPCD
ncbi:MAG: hypothetical protein LAT51_00545 [Flavobacteriaceae bacterium]|nr:hypothetical protein [Flavobacteriaceae bacterium]